MNRRSQTRRDPGRRTSPPSLDSYLSPSHAGQLVFRGGDRKPSITLHIAPHDTTARLRVA
jgi:hypothetical protein